MRAQPAGWTISDAQFCTAGFPFISFHACVLFLPLFFCLQILCLAIPPRSPLLEFNLTQLRQLLLLLLHPASHPFALHNLLSLGPAGIMLEDTLDPCAFSHPVLSFYFYFQCCSADCLFPVK